MKFCAYFFTVWITIFTCSKKLRGVSLATAPATPLCILQEIDSIKKRPVANPPTEIYEYNYAERKIYLISAACCDFYNIAIDANCENVCAPSGGFTGKGDRKCPDFAEKAKLVQLVWKDERKGN